MVARLIPIPTGCHQKVACSSHVSVINLFFRFLSSDIIALTWIPNLLYGVNVQYPSIDIMIYVPVTNSSKTGLCRLLGVSYIATTVSVERFFL